MQLVDEANRRLADRGRGSLRIEIEGRHVVLRGPAVREASTLIEAGAAVFDVRAAAEALGMRVEVTVTSGEGASGGVPTVWATLTVHPRTGRSEPGDVVWPARPRVLGSERTAQQLSTRELIAACERGAAGEGVNVRVAPMPLPAHFGLILRAKGEEATAWLALGQAWAGIERLAQRCGWVAFLRMRSKAAPEPSTTWFSAQVEVWVLQRSGDVPSAPGNVSFQTDDWVGF